jgi:hypothetical protein
MSVRLANPLTRGALLSVVCLSLIVKPRPRGGPGPLGAVAPWGRKLNVLRTAVTLMEFITCDFTALNTYDLTVLGSVCGAHYTYGLNPLTLELNPSAQRCLTRTFTGDFAS